MERSKFSETENMVGDCSTHAVRTSRQLYLTVIRSQITECFRLTRGKTEEVTLLYFNNLNFPTKKNILNLKMSVLSYGRVYPESISQTKCTSLAIMYGKIQCNNSYCLVEMAVLRRHEHNSHTRKTYITRLHTPDNRYSPWP